jgi:hypothetical protein
VFVYSTHFGIRDEDSVPYRDVRNQLCIRNSYLNELNYLNSQVYARKSFFLQLPHKSLTSEVEKPDTADTSGLGKF